MDWVEVEVEEALTKLLRKEEGSAEPLAGTSPVVAENPRPCLNLAAPSPRRVNSS